MSWTAFATAIVKDHELARRMMAGPLADPALERRLTGVRRALLLQGAGPDHAPLLMHLALQGFLNEYAWWEGPDETERLATLSERDDELGLLLYAAYRPLAGRADARCLLARPSGPLLAPVVRRQVADVLAEADLAAAMPVITAIRDDVSQAVRAQYEANPYPRWTPAGSGPPMDEAAEILVAGCGTGRVAIGLARRQPKSRILAVDLSRASLAYAQRTARDLGCGNITFAQADILELGALGRTFDVVECSGVLHHMADPVAGARALAGLLRPGGRLGLGLYSTTGRAHLAAGQALAAGYPATPDGIRALRRAILDSPDGAPVREVLTSSDFYAVSTCRDLLMHVQEHTLDLADIQRMLDDCGLEPDLVMLPPPILELYRRTFPQAAPNDLDAWAAFERRHPATFRGMYRLAARKPL